MNGSGDCACKECTVPLWCSIPVHFYIDRAQIVDQDSLEWQQTGCDSEFLVDRPFFAGPFVSFARHAAPYDLSCQIHVSDDPVLLADFIGGPHVTSMEGMNVTISY